MRSERVEPQVLQAFMEVVRCDPQSREQRSDMRCSELALKRHLDCCAEKTTGGLRAEMGRLVTAI